MASSNRNGTKTAPTEAASVADDAMRRVEELQDEITRLNDKIADQNRQIRDLRRETIRDSLTGLLNRRGFQRVVDRTLDFVRRYDSPVALIFIDMDAFKIINDTHGHASGDEVLCHVAKVIRATLRSSDVVGRIGGDEFVALLWKADEKNARETAVRVTEALIAAPAQHDGMEIAISASVGVATLVAEDDVDAVLDRADRDMYRAKSLAAQ